MYSALACKTSLHVSFTSIDPLLLFGVREVTHIYLQEQYELSEYSIPFSQPFPIQPVIQIFGHDGPQAGKYATLVAMSRNVEYPIFPGILASCIYLFIVFSAATVSICHAKCHLNSATLVSARAGPSDANGFLRFENVTMTGSSSALQVFNIACETISVVWNRTTGVPAQYFTSEGEEQYLQFFEFGIEFLIWFLFQCSQLKM